MSPKRVPFFYGWFLVAIAWVCYGFGISPAFYSWSNFAAPIIEDLGLDRGDVGGVGGLFSTTYQCVGLLVGLALVRFGIRRVMTAGFLTTALGMLYLSWSDSALDCYIGFSILGGAGIGFSTIVPCQTLAQNWFLKRLALALGIIFTAGGIVGLLVAQADIYVLEHADWRTGWLVIAGVSAVLAVVAAALVRDTPEQLGQQRDGMPPEEARAPNQEGVVPRDANQPASAQDAWTALQAVRTPQFLLMVICGIAYAVPWNTVVYHLNLHLQDVGYSPAVAATFVGTMALISVLGRLVGMLGDWVPPQYVLAASLVLEGLGTGGLLLAENQLIAFLCITLIGLGFGAAYISVPVVFSLFFGRRAFSVTTGLRMTITGVFSGLGPWLTGLLFDATGAYTLPFLGLMGVGLLGAVSAASLRHPGSPRPTS